MYHEFEPWEAHSTIIGGATQWCYVVSSVLSFTFNPSYRPQFGVGVISRNLRQSNVSACSMIVTTLYPAHVESAFPAEPVRALP